jgi:Peroxidase, family 2
MLTSCAARGPCPGLNTLANHNYLPHNGRGITLSILAKAMLDGFNIARSDAVTLFSQAIRTNPSYPAANSFDLEHLGTHNILEHDISLRYASPILFHLNHNPRFLTANNKI